MWNRESNKSSSPGQPVTSYEPAPVAPAAPAIQPPPPTPVTPVAPVAAKGSTLSLKGELSGSEDLLLEGRVEGKISLPDHILTIGLGAEVAAEISARVVVLLGKISGNVMAFERMEIRASGRMNGDLVSPRVQMADGATFSGRLETRNPAKGGNKSSKSEIAA